MNKTVKVILKQTSLRNNLLKYRCEANKRSYKGQRHLCPVDIVVYRNVTDSKTWWNSITPSVIKIINKENITVVEDSAEQPMNFWKFWILFLWFKKKLEHSTIQRSNSWFYNRGHKILRLFDILRKFSVTTSETGRDW